ncbi:kinase-like protein [Lentithecium fluviatile CBS 122367]|uniref:non-specific serine/threonine protein kinase n=1 Tax=Lentithecium fluviatile CBS 122367 TaxID=1168545 RepID=A0A6G1JB17_9PLEO|nr:kinase-like protein [Lentithecium fluviatile CBS 122367]
MASRASSASEGEIGEVIERKKKANSTNQSNERTINDSDRVFGLDGSWDSPKYNGRGLSRSPSPYRAPRKRSPSPYRASRNRSPPRKPSRSPSPYRHSNGRSRGSGFNDSRPPHKRKASPPRGRRPDKRHHADRNRANDRRSKFQFDEVRAALHSGGNNDRKQPKPVSYAGNENPAPVPDFREGLKPNGQPLKHDSDRYRRVEFERDSEADGKAATNTPATAYSTTNGDVQMTGTNEEPDLEPATEHQAPTQETREEKRRRWAAIRAAAENKAKENLLQQALLANASETATSNVASPAAATEGSISSAGSPRIGNLDSVPASPEVMVVDKQEAPKEENSPTTRSPSAADYDPTKDMLDDRDRIAQKARQAEMSSDAYRETNPKALSTLPVEKVLPVKKQKEFDMFSFSDGEDEEEETIETEVSDAAKGTVLDEKLLDNWDDPEGYYKIISNELVNDGRYRMIKHLGRGVFANVAQAEDTKTPNDADRKLVAIKIIRRNDLMRKSSQKEIDFLRKVNDEDPHDKQHIIRLFGSFDHKGHLCVVFEHMSKNLRDLLKEDTNGHGLSLQAVRTYARQMFSALRHLQHCQVVHCDLKPDNILVSADKKTVKLCDFGTAVDRRDIMERTEYLVSRFYRAPEIILGMEIGYGIDMWAVGCTVYELWTGKILFTGRTNNQMVKAFIDCLGWPSEKLLKKGLLTNVIEHFEAGPPLKFISREVDQHGNLSTRKIEQQKKIARDLKTRIQDATRGITQGAPTATELNDFAELLGACLNLNVDKRLQPKEALAHKFFPQPKPKTAVIKPTMVKRGATVRR